jgi:hypothetical protein
MFSLNTILAWNINIFMNKKYDNNNIIIDSRAYFLQYSHHCRCLFTGEEELEDPTGLDTPIQGSPILQLP